MGLMLHEGPRRAIGPAMQKMLFASLVADHTADLYAAPTAHPTQRLGILIGVVEQAPSEERQRILYRGEAHLEATCGPRYIYATDRV